MKELDNYRVICEFCDKTTEFKNSKQVTLKIDKKNSYQNLLATICNTCIVAGKRKTVNGQITKIITNRNKEKNEESVFDVIEGED